MQRRALLVVVLLLGLVGCSDEVELSDTTQTYVDHWLHLVDSGAYGQSWAQSSKIFKAGVAENTWIQKAGEVRELFGALVERKLTSARAKSTLDGAPDGNYVVVEFATTFEQKQNAVETLILFLESDNKWRTAGYFIR